MADRIEGTPELRKKLKRFYREYWRVNAQIREIEKIRSSEPPVFMKDGKLVLRKPPVLPKSPTFPEECRGMTCAAKTRKGTPCKITDLYDNGRCKFHGGASTGPRTKRGKKRSARNGLIPKQRGKNQARQSSPLPQRSEAHGTVNIQARLPQVRGRYRGGPMPCG